MKHHHAFTAAPPAAILLAWIALIASSALAAPAIAQCQYEVTAVIEGPGCPPVGTPTALIGRGMNNAGEVVGSYAACLGCGASCYDSAFFWSEATGLITLPTPDGVIGSRAFDINDHGRICGEALVPGNGWRGFMYDMNTDEFQFLQPLHEGATATFTSSANAINNNGVVAGSRVISKPGQSPVVTNAVIWDTTAGEVTDLGVMNGPNSAAADVSDEGEATGWSGNSPESETWGLIENELIMLGNPDGSVGSAGLAINSHLQIAGGGNFVVKGFSFPLGSAGFWENDSWSIITMLPYCQSSAALSINDVGQIVGLCNLSTGSHRGFLWQNGEVFDLSDLTGVEIGRANDLNNNGQILVRIGGTRAGLLTPIDVPLTDLNYDCRTDIYDLILLIEQWGVCDEPADCRADFNGNGRVGLADLIILINNWD